MSTCMEEYSLKDCSQILQQFPSTHNKVLLNNLEARITTRKPNPK